VQLCDKSKISKRGKFQVNTENIMVGYGEKWTTMKTLSCNSILLYFKEAKKRFWTWKHKQHQDKKYTIANQCCLRISYEIQLLFSNTLKLSYLRALESHHSSGVHCFPFFKLFFHLSIESLACSNYIWSPKLYLFLQK
jgi:hypothetical protein